MRCLENLHSTLFGQEDNTNGTTNGGPVNIKTQTELTCCAANKKKKAGGPFKAFLLRWVLNAVCPF